jgi:anti-sigma B factor antagonist
MPVFAHDESLHWCVEPSAAATVVHVAGEIDLSTEPDFTDAIANAFSHCSTLVVADLREVEFMGSTGLNVLLQARQHAELAGQSFRLANPSKAVHRAMRISGVDQVLPVFDTVELALAA